eukprot:2385953-Rhodomonas_salina.1
MSFSFYSQKVLPMWLAAVMCLGSIASTPDDALLSRWGGEGFGAQGLQKQFPLAFSATPIGLPGFHIARQRSSNPQPPLKLAHPRRDCSLLSTVYAKSEDVKGAVSTVETSQKPKRRRGIGANLVITPRSEQPNVDTDGKGEQSGHSETSSDRKQKGRRKAEVDEKVNSAFGEDSDEPSIDEELEQEWKEQVKRQGSIRPAGARVRSRIRTEDQGEEGKLEGKQDLGSAIKRHKDLQLREMLRRTSIVTKGSNANASAALFVNPGFIDRRNSANERSAEMDSRAGSVSLLDLKRLGLVDPAVSAADIRRGADAVEREIHVGMAIFDMQDADVDSAVRGTGDGGCGCGSWVVGIVDVGCWMLDVGCWGFAAWLGGGWRVSVAKPGVESGKCVRVQVHGGRVFSAGSDDHITVWNASTFEPIAKLEGHSAWVNALLVDEERQLLLSGSDDGSVRAWDLQSLECLR